MGDSGRGSPARVKGLVGLAQEAAVHVGVDLRGADVGVAQHLLCSGGHISLMRFGFNICEPINMLETPDILPSIVATNRKK